MVKTTTCGLCGHRFEEDAGQPVCLSCPLRGGCRFVRCPSCGYENAVVPNWLERLRSWAVLDLTAEEAELTEVTR